MKYIIYLLTGLLAFTVFSCDEDSGDEKLRTVGCNYDFVLNNQTDNVIMPLAVGNYWIYEKSVYDNDDVLVSRYYDTIEVVKVEIIDGETMFLVEQRLDSSSDEYKKTKKWLSYKTNTDAGLWEATCNLKDSSLNFGCIRAYYPCKNNDVYYTSIPSLVYDNGEYNIYTTESNVFVTMPVTVETPTETFHDCNKYSLIVDTYHGSELIQSFPKADFYYKPNIGMITLRLEMTNEIYRLIEYNLVD